MTSLDISSLSEERTNKNSTSQIYMPRGTEDDVDGTLWLHPCFHPIMVDVGRKLFSTDCNTVTMASRALVCSAGAAFVSSFTGRGIARFRTMSSIRCDSTTSMSAVKKPKADIKSFRLAPSDFAFLWEECQRCFYLKAHKKLYRPRAPFPSIFGAIDLAMKMHLRGLPTHELLPEMPKGVFLCEKEDAWVECKPITPPGHENSVYIRGMVSRTAKLAHIILRMIADTSLLNTELFPNGFCSGRLSGQTRGRYFRGH